MKQYLYYNALLSNHDLIYAYDTIRYNNWPIRVRYGAHKQFRACTAKAWSVSRADGTA